MDLETDFPEIMPEAPTAPMVTQPATIQTTMTLEEMMGGEELGEQPEKLSAYGTPKRVYPEGSLLTEPSCEGGHYCFSCAEMDCDIRGKDCQCWYAPCGNPFPCEIVAERSLDLLTEQMGDKCQFVNHDLAYHCAGTGEAAPCCSRCENPCNLACKRVTVERGSKETVATSQQETPSTVLETAAQPAANNHESAAEKQHSGKCLHNPLYDCSMADEDKTIPGTGERYYRYNLPDGTSFVVKTYHSMLYDYKAGIGMRRKEGYGANEQYILEPGRFFRDCSANRSAMIEKLKELQKGERC